MSADFCTDELNASERLPAPSGLALSIMHLIQKGGADVQKLVKHVEGDSALNERILSIANFSAFGIRQPIANVNDSVITMGMQSTRLFALSLSIVCNNCDGHCPGFDYEAYWAKALAMAVATAAITAHEHTITPEEAFTLGLLSDIGRLALAATWPDIYGDCLRAVQGDDLLHLERERFAVDHRELTLMLLRDWGFPDPFLSALKLSFESSNEISLATRFAEQLSFAQQLACYCVADDPYRAVLLPGLQQQAAADNLEGIVISQLIEDISRQWYEWGLLIEINTDVRLPFPDSQNEQTDTPQGLDLLLVDDDPMTLAQLSKQLSAAGHRISVCRDGESALKHIFEHKPQLVITDWRMRPMDGLTLCKTLRGADIGKNIYLIMLTATESEDALIKAFDAGVDDYVTKPVNMRILQARIRAGQRVVILQQEVQKERQDIQRYSAELSVANRRLEMMAYTDVLTSLPNRRYALSRLEQEWSSAQRYNRPLSVLMLDLDYFKSINDTLGHDAGDVALAHAAKLIKATVRASDIACRLGGEEFLVIATNTDGASAALLSERIRCSIQTHQPGELALVKPMTISIGVASSAGRSCGWEELIKLADQALYKAKAGSRNAVQLA